MGDTLEYQVAAGLVEYWVVDAIANIPSIARRRARFDVDDWAIEWFWSGGWTVTGRGGTDWIKRCILARPDQVFATEFEAKRMAVFLLQRRVEYLRAQMIEVEAALTALEDPHSCPKCGSHRYAVRNGSSPESPWITCHECEFEGES